jgi:hypothetical protein
MIMDMYTPVKTAQRLSYVKISGILYKVQIARNFWKSYSSGSASYHFHNAPNPIVASTGRQFMNSSRLMVTRRTCFDGNETRECSR